MDRLALRANPDSAHRLVLVVGCVGVRQPGRLLLLRCLRLARHAGMGRRDHLVRQASRAVALGTLGDPVRTPARQAQPGHPRRAPRRRHRSTPPPLTPSLTRTSPEPIRLSPHAHHAPTRAPASLHRLAFQAPRKGIPAAQLAPLAFAAHNCTEVPHEHTEIRTRGGHPDRTLLLPCSHGTTDLLRLDCCGSAPGLSRT